MRLLEDFWFIDRKNRKWIAPVESKIDGASIPQALWTLVGSPYTGSYRRASIVHDVACDEATTPNERRAADRMFYEACRAGGCSVEEAASLCLGVRLGAIWDGLTPTDKAVTRPHLTPGPFDRRIEADFQMTAHAVLKQPLADDADEIERRVDEALDGLRTLPSGPR